MYEGNVTESCLSERSGRSRRGARRHARRGEGAASPPCSGAPPRATRGRAEGRGAERVALPGVGRRGRGRRRQKNDLAHGVRDTLAAAFARKPIDAPGARIAGSGRRTAVRRDGRQSRSGRRAVRAKKSERGGRVSAKHALGSADAGAADLPNRDYRDERDDAAVASTFAGEVEPTRRVEPAPLRRGANLSAPRAVRARYSAFAAFTQDSRAMFRDP